MPQKVGVKLNVQQPDYQDLSEVYTRVLFYCDLLTRSPMYQATRLKDCAIKSLYS